MDFLPGRAGIWFPVINISMANDGFVIFERFTTVFFLPFIEIVGDFFFAMAAKSEVFGVYLINPMTMIAC